MHCTRSLAFIGWALASPAFAFMSPSRGVDLRQRVSLRAARDPDDSSPNAIRNFAAASMVSLGLLFPSSGALALDTIAKLPSDHSLQSSSVRLSVEIKTMDFSMPSSYDSIATPTASGSEELTQDYVKKPTPKAKPVKKKAAPKQKSEGGGGGMSIAMPSISNPFAGGGDSSGPSAKEKAAAKQADKKAAREAEEAAQKEADREKALKLQEEIKAAREARIAAKAAERAAEEAAAAEKAAAAEAQ